MKEDALEAYEPQSLRVGPPEKVVHVEAELTVEQVMSQVNKIQQVMDRAMKKDQHYGTIPGTQKPTLYKPGAEKLGLTFRLAPKFKVERFDLPSGHREYEITCSLYHIKTGEFWGEGVGNCSTMESKYLYRSENTGRIVPKEYWKNRDASVLGGKDYFPKKTKNGWFIFQRVENDNPADNNNTVKKMAKKRAHIDAMLTATAASDIFTQDLEEIIQTEEEKVIEVDDESSSKAEKAPASSTTRSPRGVITDKQRKRIFAIAKDVLSKGDPNFDRMTAKDQSSIIREEIVKILGAYGYENTEEILIKDYEAIVEQVEGIAS